MSTIENILGMFPDRIGEKKDANIFTPSHIAREMVDALPDDIWNKDITFLDICCKSGIFLYKIYQKLMESPSMIKDFPDETDRAKHIIHKQLFGIAPSAFCQVLSTRTIYGYLDPENNIISINEYELVMRNENKTFLYKTLQKEFNTVKFDIVIGNPPYNNDAYLDFVTLGHQLSNKYTMMITPAKWQAKGGAKNEQFRKEIVPYMSKIAFYVNSGDIFDIREVTGISYYLIDKNNIHKEKYIKAIDKLESHKALNDDWHMENNLITLHSRKLNNIINKITGDKLRYAGGSGDKKVIVSLNLANGGGKTSYSCFSSDGFMNVVNPLVKINSINELISYGNNYKIIYNFKTDIECESFISYINTRFIRFCIYMGVCGQSITNDETWRFVPMTEAFDHIFTDQELYKKYNLSPEEINIIESVIKERK